MPTSSSGAAAALPVVISIILTASPQALTACDLCSTPTAPDAGTGLSVGISEQYTHFGTLRENGHAVSDDVGQRMDSSVTQIVAGYRFGERGSAQIVVPYIHRSFRRAEGFSVDEGSEQGLGDVTVLGTYRVLRIDGDDLVLRIDDIGGIKVPTGRSGRLAEEADEVVVPGAPESGVHGHDLALGSGSWDVVIGEDVFARRHRAFIGIHAQYTIRTRGSHGYRYADDLTWNVTPGVDVWRSGPSRLGLAANLCGEAKDKDVAHGEVAQDTGMVAVYLGPAMTFAWRRRFLAEAGVDLPLVQNDTALQLVPDYRLHGGALWTF
jgi:hypothetical protein